MQELRVTDCSCGKLQTKHPNNNRLFFGKSSLCCYQRKTTNNKLVTKSCIDTFLTASSSCLVSTSVKLCHYCP